MSRKLSALAGILALLGGAFILASGYRTPGMLFSVLNFANQHFGASLPAVLQAVTTVTITVLTVIIALGGLLVIGGGLLLLIKHVFSGRLLILLGGGFGFFGILIAVGIAFIGSGWDGIVAHLDYWIGIVLATLARYFAK